MTEAPIDWKADVRRHLRDVSIIEERQMDIVEEIAQDLEQRFAELRRSGAEMNDARRRVLAQLTDDADLATRLAQVTRARWRQPLPGLLRRHFALDAVAQDVRYAARMCARRPGFTTVSVGAIALGIGSITAVFSLSHAVLLRPFPPVHFDCTVLVWQQDLPNGRDRITLSPLEYHAYGEAPSFSAIGAVRGLQLSVIAGDTPVAVSGVQVTPGLQDTLGVQPIVGRGFAEERGGPAHEAMVTAEFWRRHLGGDAGVIGRTLSLRAGFSGGPPGSPPIDGSYVIVGVLPAGVSLPYRAADIWIPFSVSSTGAASTVPSLVVLARLHDGATLSQASVEISAIERRLAAQYQERHKALTTWLVTLREETVGDITPTLVLLAASVLLLGVMVCANTGTLLLSRLSERQRELTIRGALGRNHWSIGASTVGRIARAWPRRRTDRHPRRLLDRAAADACRSEHDSPRRRGRDRWLGLGGGPRRHGSDECSRQPDPSASSDAVFVTGRPVSPNAIRPRNRSSARSPDDGRIRGGVRRRCGGRTRREQRARTRDGVTRLRPDVDADVSDFTAAGALRFD
jgi:hypothetical protein